MSFIKSYKKNGSKTDEELLKEFESKGDLEVLGQLYSKYMHLVYGVCLKYLKNREEAMDAVMQIFEKLITEVPRQKIKSFRNWLHVVARNYCLMQLRSQKSLEEKHNEWKNDTIIFMENDLSMHPIDGVESNMEKELDDCIRNLKNDQKKCIHQFYFENKCYAEIALNMGLDEKNVKSHLQNAKRNLKICLEEKNGKQK